MIDKSRHYLCSCGVRLFAIGYHLKNNNAIIEFECMACEKEWFGCAFIEPTELELITQDLKEEKS